jgi:GNAT superfamily N-acetyltransferase
VQTRRVESSSDFDRLEELLLAYEADLPPDLRHGRVPDPVSLLASYSGRSAAFLAVGEEGPVGCVAVREFDALTAVLMRLFVRPNHRGAGAARALLETAIEFSKERGYGRIVLDSHKRRLRAAYELYRSLGFQECAPYARVDYQCPTFMELQLGAQR